MPSVGYSYASKNKQRFEETIQTVMKLLVPCMVLIMILCWIFAGKLFLCALSPASYKSRQAHGCFRVYHFIFTGCNFALRSIE
jgi:Na+-driven multidrug efflux pump